MFDKDHFKNLPGNGNGNRLWDRIIGADGVTCGPCETLPGAFKVALLSSRKVTIGPGVAVVLNEWTEQPEVLTEEQSQALKLEVAAHFEEEDRARREGPIAEIIH